MQYRLMVKQVMNYSGFSDRESETALKMFTGTLAARLEPGEQQNFASQLPEELKDIALEVPETVKASMGDFYEAFSRMQDIDEGHAKKQIMAVWKTFKDALTSGEIRDIRLQLPGDMAAQLQ
jgi:uncharacterized protein (DUF2267 family)